MVRPCLVAKKGTSEATYSLRAAPDGPAGRLDVLHAALRVPADVHGVDLASRPARR